MTISHRLEMDTNSLIPSNIQSVFIFPPGLAFLKIFLHMDHFLMSLSNVLQYCFYFYVLGFLATRHEGSQLPDQGLNLHPLHWKVKS